MELYCFAGHADLVDNDSIDIEFSLIEFYINGVFGGGITELNSLNIILFYILLVIILCEPDSDKPTILLLPETTLTQFVKSSSGVS
jgi:hypothetical protein